MTNILSKITKELCGTSKPKPEKKGTTRRKTREWSYEPGDLPLYYPSYFIMKEDNPGKGFTRIKEWDRMRYTKAYIKEPGLFSDGVIKIYFDPRGFPAFPLICQILSHTSFAGLAHSILYLRQLKYLEKLSTRRWRKSLRLFQP